MSEASIPVTPAGEAAVLLRTFLVVVDETEEMRNALRYACRRAQHTSGRVALVYVVEPASAGGAGRIIASDSNEIHAAHCRNAGFFPRDVLAGRLARHVY